MHRSLWAFGIAGGGLVGLMAFSVALVLAQNVWWGKQFGTTGEDQGLGVAVAGTSICVAGRAEGTLDGQTFAGVADAFLRCHNTAGNRLWTKQFGTAFEDQAMAVTSDSQGNLVVVGFTGGPLFGTSQGGDDAFVVVFDSNGNTIWSNQFGTSLGDHAQAVAVDASGNIIVVGTTQGALPNQSSHGRLDFFVRKYSATGTILWTIQSGTSDIDYATRVAADGEGAIYVAGYTYGAFDGYSPQGSEDAFLMKITATGTVAWTRQFGTLLGELATSVGVGPDGSVYVAGFTFGDLGGTNLGSGDIFLRSYNADGNEGWTVQFGTSLFEQPLNMALNASSGIYLAGFTLGGFPGQVWAGGEDAFVAKIDASGTLVWIRQFGTTASDRAQAISLDGNGDIFVAGITGGTFPGQTSAGGTDVFLAKISMQAPPPGAPPVAQNSSVTTAQNTPVNITLVATDPDSLTITYWIVSPPANGTLSGVGNNGQVTGNQVTYTPNPGFTGADSFTWKAYDGTSDSNIATVTITVLQVASGFTLGEFVVLSDEFTWLRQGTIVASGSIGSNSALPNPPDKDKGKKDDDKGRRDRLVEVIIGEQVQVATSTSRVAGDTVWLRKGSQVYDVYYNELYQKQGTILGVEHASITLPIAVFPSLPRILPGTDNVEVPRRESDSRGPGTYGAVIVRKNATLTLFQGDYHISSLYVEEGGKILFQGNAHVLVKNWMRTGQRVFIGPDPSTPNVQPSNIVFTVAGKDARSLHPLDDTEDEDDDDAGDNRQAPFPRPPAHAVHIGQRNTLQANIYAPNGTIFIRQGTEATGAFIGKRVIIGERVTLALDSAF